MVAQAFLPVFFWGHRTEISHGRSPPDEEHRMAELNIVEKVIALEGVDLLNGLNPDQLARIASISTEVRYPPGKVVLDPSKPLDALFVVLDGAVSLIKDGVEIHIAKQNDVLGAWALFDSEPM